MAYLVKTFWISVRLFFLSGSMLGISVRMLFCSALLSVIFVATSTCRSVRRDDVAFFSRVWNLC